MKLTWQTAATRTVIVAQWLLAGAACLALLACAGTPERPATAQRATGGAAPAAAGAAPASDPVEHSRQFQHADALYLSGHLKEAEAAFEQLSRSYPNDARVWLKYGNTLTKERSYDDAAVAFQNAASLDPQQGGAALNLALVRLAQAQSALQEARARFAADSPEYREAEGLEHQIGVLLGPLGHEPTPH
jgi:TolA-binding protein